MSLDERHVGKHELGQGRGALAIGVCSCSKQCMASSHADVEARSRRRAVRAQAEVNVFRGDSAEAEAEVDALSWDRIPVDERAQLVWKPGFSVRLSIAGKHPVVVHRALP